VDEALVQRHGVLGGDAPGVLALGQAAGLEEDDVDEVAEEALIDADLLRQIPMPANDCPKTRPD
jgi:hypothetical protein